MFFSLKTVEKLSAVNPTPHVSSNPGTKLACSFLSQNSGAKTLSMMTFSVTTRSVKSLRTIMLSVRFIYCCAECRLCRLYDAECTYAECPGTKTASK
jgi:hypothetical protein